MSTHKKQSDALSTIGQIIDDSAGRDAIHIAVYPAVAGEKLRPGDHVGLIDGKAFILLDIPAIKVHKQLGIVDPFLQLHVNKGQRFWLFLYPNSITSLRHVWSHPGFEEEAVQSSEIESADKAESVVWLTKYAESIESSFEQLIDNTNNYVKNGAWWCGGEEWFAELELPDKFWDHYQLVTGTIVPRDKQESFFSCAC